jgi:hypothetical protein
MNELNTRLRRRRLACRLTLALIVLSGLGVLVGYGVDHVLEARDRMQ